MILSNEIPKLSDASGVMATRFVALRTRISHLGREDKTLEGRLLAELPGILHWALEGVRRLHANGRFTQPESGREVLDQMRRMTSHIRAFVEECCSLDPGVSIEKGRLYEEYTRWCERSGVRHPYGHNAFSPKLQAAFPGIDEARPRRDGVLGPREYVGIELADRW